NVPAMQQAADLDVAPYLWAFTGIPSDLGDLDAFDDNTLIFSQFSLTVGEGATIPALDEGEAKLDEALGDDLILPEITIVAYNFTQLLAQGIEKAQSTDDPVAVAEAMEGLRYNGPFGKSRIDPMHFQDHQTGQIVYQDGETTVYVYGSMTDVDPSEEIVIE
ncbi:MAG: ABC transporter substrate-binding protein, partial [Acidimicrobiia bacterium]